MWSSTAFNGDSTVSAETTFVSGLLAIFGNCNVSGSKALASTSGGTKVCFSEAHNDNLATNQYLFMNLLNDFQKPMFAARCYWPRRLAPL